MRRDTADMRRVVDTRRGAGFMRRGNMQRRAGDANRRALNTRRGRIGLRRQVNLRREVAGSRRQLVVRRERTGLRRVWHLRRVEHWVRRWVSSVGAWQASVVWVGEVGGDVCSCKGIVVCGGEGSTSRACKCSWSVREDVGKVANAVHKVRGEVVRSKGKHT